MISITEHVLVGVVGEIENSDHSNSVILKIGTRDSCVDFFTALNEQDRQAFAEIFVMEKTNFEQLAKAAQETNGHRT